MTRGLLFWILMLLLVVVSPPWPWWPAGGGKPHKPWVFDRTSGCAACATR
jgi:hypothetical protein